VKSLDYGIESEFMLNLSDRYLLHWDSILIFVISVDV